jgi:hypothetical protein
MRKIKNYRIVVVEKPRAIKMATYYMLIWPPAT